SCGPFQRLGEVQYFPDKHKAKIPAAIISLLQPFSVLVDVGKAPTAVPSKRQALVRMNDTSTEDLVIQIRDCNSISDARIALRQSALNIKYGANGVGKSTIARALQLRAGGDDSLNPLVPFKYRGVDGAPPPSVVGADVIKKVLVFDEDYV